MQPQLNPNRPASTAEPARRPTSAPARRERSTPPGRDRSITELFADLTHETTELLQKEIELARVEIADKLSQVQSGISSLALGGAVVYAGLLVLLVAAVLGLDRLIQEPWLSTLIVGGAVTLIGAGLLAKGRKELELDELAPERSLRSLRKDTELVEKHVSSE